MKHYEISINKLINLDYYKNLEKIFKCQICTNLIYNPTDCEKCGNSFCYFCITNKSCPFQCKNSLNKIKQSSQGIKFLFSSLILKCLFSENCKEEIPYEEIYIHEFNCQYKLIPCQFCSIQIKRNEMENHIEIDCLGSHTKDKKINISNQVKLNVNINIPQIIKQTELERNHLTRETNKLKNEINFNVDNLFKNIVRKKKESKDSRELKEKKLISDKSLFKIENVNEISMCSEHKYVMSKFLPYDNNTTQKSHSNYENLLTPIVTLIPEIKTDVDLNKIKIEEIFCLIKEIIKLLSNKDSDSDFAKISLNYTNEFSLYNEKILKSISQKDENTNSFLVKKMKDVIEKLLNELSDIIKSNFIELKDLNSKAIIKSEIMLKRSKFNSPNISQDISIKDTDASIPESKNISSGSININQTEIISEINKIKSYLVVELSNIKESIKIKTFEASSQVDKFIQLSNIHEKSPDNFKINQQQIPLSSISDSYKIKESLRHLDKKISDLLLFNESKFKDIITSCLKELHNLKWCQECEKVDYFYGFLECEICKNTNCKNCVLLCKSCKKLYCKTCLICPKCDNFSCLNCRESCITCLSINISTKYCSSCLNSCLKCKSKICKVCTKNCFNCKNPMCESCSRSCDLCQVSCCIKCGKFTQFTQCYSCKSTVCKNCIQNCNICDLEVCKKCIFKCKICKREGCGKNLISCFSCKSPYCNKCSNEKKHIHCKMCNSNFCEICQISDLVKCLKCPDKFCRKCYTVCRKCKGSYCLDCKSRCDNCKDITCIPCSYQCACEKYNFCEKCLFDVNPICSHDCVFFINERPFFSTSKTRSILSLPQKFEAKFYIEKMHSKSFLIGITDNCSYEEDSIMLIDNVWLYKPFSGEKYSTENGIQTYMKPAKEKDYIIIIRNNEEIFFRVNYDPPIFAFKLNEKSTQYHNKEFYFYLENDSPLETTKIVFVYIRKI